MLIPGQRQYSGSHGGPNMSESTTRRAFLKTAAAAASIAGTASATAAGTGIKKAILISMLPKTMSYADRFKLARDVGFDLMEAQTIADEREAEEIRRAAEDAKLRIHSVMNMDHWKFPLSSPNPEEVEKSLQGMRTSLRNAKLWGAETVLLVPAVVNPQTSYRDAWTRSQPQIRKLIPLAEELKVIIAVEEVSNKFLLSPLEFAKYVDEFNSPWIRAYFDCGNIVSYAYPEDWIRTLGKRIVRVHLKDYKREIFKSVNLGEGSIDWAAVRQAFAEIGYAGPATVELPAGDEAYLRDISQRVDRLVLGVA